MKKYFNSLQAINKFTMELDHDTLTCEKCSKRGQFVSHGFVYKKGHKGERHIMGKRIFCSNRNGRSGCGRTTIIYLEDSIPALTYATSHVYAFVRSLMSGSSIRKAYKTATDTDDPRNAYRWLHKLYNRLMDYRGFLSAHTVTSSIPFRHRTRQLRLLLPTLQSLFLKMWISPCGQYQSLTQKSFI
jgi:hypothetical protein